MTKFSFLAYRFKNKWASWEMTPFHRPLEANCLHTEGRSLKSIRASKSRTAQNYKYLYRNKPPWCSSLAPFLSLDATECSRRLSRRSKLPAGTRSRLLSFSLHVPCPLASTKALLCLSVSPSLSSTVHFRYFPDVSGGTPIYTLSTGAGSVKMGTSELPLRRQTALIAYSWFSTIDEAVLSNQVLESQWFSDYPSAFPCQTWNVGK